jgi:hypothetical protein
MAALDPFRPRWDVRTPAGERLVVEHDRLRQRWRVTPGGYEARSLRRALAQACGTVEDAAWIGEISNRLDRASRR